MHLRKEENPFVKVIYQNDACFRIVLLEGNEKRGIPYDDVENELQSITP